MASPQPSKIGLIIGSQRPVRIAPEVANFILITLNQNSPKLQSRAMTIETIDLLDHNLPIFDEPIIPQHIHNPSDYHNEHTRIWSRRIASCNGFIILSAQRNWSVPAELKNAIDYLFNEWKDKPVMLVTYGGRGGLQCAEHLRQVLGKAIGCEVLERGVSMSFEGAEFRGNALRGERIGLAGEREEGLWAGYRGNIVSVFEELVGRVEEKAKAKGGVM